MPEPHATQPFAEAGPGAHSNELSAQAVAMASEAMPFVTAMYEVARAEVSLSRAAAGQLLIMGVLAGAAGGLTLLALQGFALAAMISWAHLSWPAAMAGVMLLDLSLTVAAYWRARRLRRLIGLKQTCEVAGRAWQAFGTPGSVSQR
jgi:uncharacterized membrane protein YqjE